MLITFRLKEIKKRRALRGKHPDMSGLINSVGKRTVVLPPKESLQDKPFFFLLLAFHRLAHSSLSVIIALRLGSILT
jgi:hypothetical protein